MYCILPYQLFMFNAFNGLDTFRDSKLQLHKRKNQIRDAVMNTLV